MLDGGAGTSHALIEEGVRAGEARSNRKRLGSKILRSLTESSRLGEAFNAQLQSLFHRVGFCIGTHPWLFLLLTLLLSTVTCQVVHVRFAQRLQDGFIASRSPSRTEHHLKTQFDGHEGSSVQRFMVMVRRADRGNLLSVERMDRVIELLRFIRHLPVSVAGQSHRHADICVDRCHSNVLLETFVHCVRSVSGNSSEDCLLDHPQSRIHHHDFLVAHHIFGVERGDAPAFNSRSRLSSIHMVALYLQAPTDTDERTNIVTHWEKAIFQWSQHQTDFPDLTVDITGDKILGQEMIRGGLSLVPYLVVGLTLTVLFVTATVLYTATRHRQRIGVGQLLIIVGIILSPFLAVSSTFGLMGVVGVEIYPIQMVIPFLILAIGVDDAFLMLHAWYRLRPSVLIAHQGDKRQAVPVLMAKVMEEIGPSITITSLTNALAFVLGTTVSMPAIQLFCIAATIAMVMDFLFEITMFGSLLAISGRCEQWHSVGEKPLPSKSHWLLGYCRWLTKNSTRIVVMSLTLVLFVVSLYGTLTTETRIDSQKIIPYDSPLLEGDRMLRQYFWKEYEPLQVIVNRPPNISDPRDMKDFESMIREFESLPRAIGNSSTMLWMNDYKKAYGDLFTLTYFLGGDGELTTEEIPAFLATKAGLVWNDTVRWHTDERGDVILDSFTFFTGFHDAYSWMDRSQNMLNWRRVVDRWSDRFNVTTFNENSPVFEGIFGIRGTTVQTALYTLFSMIAVCAVFVPSIAGVAAAAGAITSISIGVFGFLSLSGLDLDPVTMSAVIMSIGFSVDYTAHVCYHWHRSWRVLDSCAPSSARIQYTVESVGGPMLQAAASTLFCFLPLAAHPDYTPTVFIRCISLVVGMGALHGLIILPVGLAMLPPTCFAPADAPSRTFHRSLPLLSDTKADYDESLSKSDTCPSILTGSESPASLSTALDE